MLLSFVCIITILHTTLLGTKPSLAIYIATWCKPSSYSKNRSNQSNSEYGPVITKYITLQ